MKVKEVWRCGCGRSSVYDAAPPRNSVIIIPRDGVVHRCLGCGDEYRPSEKLQKLSR